MLKFVCKSITSSNRALHLCKLYSTSLKKAEKHICLQDGNQDSCIVKYLMNQFGFSKERAAYSSKYIKYENSDKPDKVLGFFKNQGFTHSQVTKLVANYPFVLSYNPQTTLLPKIEFFRSKGFSSQDLATTIACMPMLFVRSLEKCIVPSFNFLEHFLGSEKDAVLAVSNVPGTLLKLESHVKPNIETLVGAGMSQSAIACLMKTRPSIFLSGRDKLKESVKEVEDMKMEPDSCAYGLALWILTVTRKSRRDERMEAFKRWGCSEDDVLRGLKNRPNMIKISEERLNGIMSLFVHEIGWEPSEVVKKKFMFARSLNKTLIPRWSVYKELLSKGLIKGKVSMSTLFKMKEDLFLRKFVNCYKDEAPLLLKLYIEKQAIK